MADNYDIIILLNEIKGLLQKQNELLEKQQSNQQPQTKITVVGNKAQTAVPKGVNSKEDFTL